MMLLGYQHHHIGHQEYSCRIPHHYIHEKKVHYITLILSHVTKDVAVFKLRYSDFEQFNDKLEKALNQLRLPVLLPQFPGKKLFGSTYKSKKSIIHRRQELQDFMNSTLCIDKLYSLSVVKKILPGGDKHIDRQSVSSHQSQDITENVQVIPGINEISPHQFYNFTIESYQQIDDIVLYYILVKEGISNNKWRFKTRYSDLRDIHQALKNQKLASVIPEFPKRKIFGITNESPNKIETRKQNLQDYLNDLFKIKELQDSDVLMYFIENSKREGQRLQKFDELKQMARLKLKAKQIVEVKGIDEKNEKKPVKEALPQKRGLFMIRECKTQNEEEFQELQKRKNKLDNLEVLLSQYDE